MTINIFIVLFINYIAFTFVNLDANFLNWAKTERIFYVISCFAIYAYKYKIADILYGFRKNC